MVVRSAVTVEYWYLISGSQLLFAADGDRPSADLELLPT